MKASTLVNAIAAAPRTRNLGATLQRSAARSPHKPAVICGDQVVSYEAVDRSTSALARRPLREGLQTGDRVAIHWCNSVVGSDALFRLFQGWSDRSSGQQPAEGARAYILRHSGSRLCFFAANELVTLAEEARADCPDVQRARRFGTT
jgi:acyl-CoA synthetase (AMP-forming)/AMP-acid ligase II